MNEFNAEIYRIKSLFNESRLYGNIVEACDETEALKVLRDLNYEVVKPGNCTNPSTNLECVKKIIEDSGKTFSEFDSGGYCKIVVRGGHTSGGEQLLMFTHTKNGFAWRFDYGTAPDLSYFGVDDKPKIVEFRGEYICVDTDIEVEYKVDRYKIDSSTPWVNATATKTAKHTLDFSAISQ
jgi:hypothetical protein